MSKEYIYQETRNHPTTDEIIAFNQKENKARRNTINQRLEEIENKDLQYLENKEYGQEISLLLKLPGDKITVKKDFLNQLKDFNFWKEWKNQ